MPSLGSKLPPPLLYAAGLVVGVLLDRLVPIASPPRGWWLAGLPLLLLGVLLDAWALSRLLKKRTTVIPWETPTALVTDGPFRFSRNPIYVGYALMYAGVAIALGTVWGWIMLVPVLVLMDRALIPREERNLAAAFGDAYASYRARVRRWV